MRSIKGKDFRMDVSQQSTQHLVAEPLYRTFHRACLAICVVLAPVVLFLGFAFDPTGGVGVPSNRFHLLPSSAGVLAANFQAASPLQTQLFLYFNAVTVYFFPLSFIGLGLLALAGNSWDDLRVGGVAPFCGVRGTRSSGCRLRTVWGESVQRGNVPVCLFPGGGGLARGKLGPWASPWLCDYGHRAHTITGNPTVGRPPLHSGYSFPSGGLRHACEHSPTHLLRSDLLWQHSRCPRHTQVERRARARVGANG